MMSDVAPGAIGDDFRPGGAIGIIVDLRRIAGTRFDGARNPA
jgi:hypothetical protein